MLDIANNFRKEGSARLLLVWYQIEVSCWYFLCFEKSKIISEPITTLRMMWQHYSMTSLYSGTHIRDNVFPGSI